MASWNGTVTPPFAATVAPNRPFTQPNRWATGSKPRTYSRTGSGAAAKPQPCRLAAPCSHRSTPPSKLTVSRDTVRRRASPKYAGRQLIWKSSAGCQGPLQELRPATCPSWRRRQSRTAGGAVASSARIAVATEGSVAVAGSNTNARSLRAPSPLMSEPTSGVNGAPEVSRPKALTPSAALTGNETMASRECRRSKALVAHSRPLGSPAVVGAANPWLAAQQENDDWSRARVKVYDICKAAPRGGKRLTPTASCLVSDWRSEPIAVTWPNCGCTRESSEVSAPVVGTIESAGT